MNCRLNLNIREKHGMAYHIEANHVVYQDTGVFNVYFGTDARFHKRVERLGPQRTGHVIRTKALGTRQLHDAKQQLLGQIALGPRARSDGAFWPCQDLFDVRPCGDLGFVGSSH